MIVSDEGGPQELMVNNETGYVIKANDLGGFACAISEFIKDRQSIQAFGKNALEFIEDNAPDDNDVYSTILNA